LQLVNDKTKVLMIVGYTGELKLYDEAAVQERFGFGPQQLIDFKALRGDASDNIPGIAGVGDKTATKLLQDYGSVEGIYQHIGEIEGKLRERLEASRRQVELNKQLVQIDCNAPVTLDLELARFGEYDRDRVIQLFRELGFQSLVARLPDTSSASAAPKEDEIETNYRSVLTEAELDQLVKRIKKAKTFVVDVETTDLDPVRANLVGMAIGVGNGEAYYIPIASDANAAREKPAKPKAAPARAAKEKSQPLLFDATVQAIPSDDPEGRIAHSFARLSLELVREKMD